MTPIDRSISIVTPCYNEHEALPNVVSELREKFSDAEIIVVDDGSDPPLPNLEHATVLRHPYNVGNGAAIKTGVRHASGEYVIFMDSDGQHDPKDIPRFIEQLENGFDLVVGARTTASQASHGRRVANAIYNRLASLLTGYRIDDLTSGFRAARTEIFRHFLYLLPNGFSYPTTSTMAFFRCGYSVTYIPIKAARRVGKSNIRLLHDGFKFLVIILRIGALFSPMRFFLPLSAVIFIIGTLYYGYTFYSMGRFTNMSAVMYLSSLFVFLFGIVSEQISSLHYRYSEEKRWDNSIE
ncbi:MAG: glycosyltransferase family 2 protein [Gammaproteobacteria bacterium]|nr:glycosyltransferase family 2 protein [Gammaproteobacteria bacterium]